MISPDTVGYFLSKTKVIHSLNSIIGSLMSKIDITQELSTSVLTMERNLLTQNSKTSAPHMA